MTGLRTYGDACGIARALDLLGERWALLIVRELVFGPKRFTELEAGLAGASPNVLSQRLRELESSGVVRRHEKGSPLYELTDFGQELHPILVQLGRWGARAVAPARGSDMSIDALMLALESTFVPDKAADVTATYEVRLGEARFSVDVDNRTISIVRGRPRNAHATIDADPSMLRAVVFGDQKLADSGIELGGDVQLARKFLRLFARPVR